NLPDFDVRPRLMLRLRPSRADAHALARREVVLVEAFDRGTCGHLVLPRQEHADVSAYCPRVLVGHTSLCLRSAWKSQDRGQTDGQQLSFHLFCTPLPSSHSVANRMPTAGFRLGRTI